MTRTTLSAPAGTFVNRHAHTAVFGGRAAILDLAAGRWRFLTPSGTTLWLRLTDGDRPNDAIEATVAFYAATGADPDRVRADMKALTRQLADARLLTGSRTAPASVRAGRPRTPCLPRPGTRLPVPGAAACGLGAALLALKTLPLRTVAAAAARIGGRPAGMDEVVAMRTAVRAAAAAYPGRVACLEESLAIVLGCAMRGSRPEWVLGARFAPAGAHAWVEVAGVPLRDDGIEDGVWPWHPAIRV